MEGGRDMQQAVYEDYKYSMQDTNRIYVGSRYTFRELLDQEELLFKLRMLVERYVLPEADLEDTLETHLYYLSPESFLVKIYRQMKARVRVSVIEEKKGLLWGRLRASKAQKGGSSAGREKRYVTRQLTVEELTAMPPEEKERRGLVVQELSVSKLALLGM